MDDKLALDLAYDKLKRREQSTMQEKIELFEEAKNDLAFLRSKGFRDVETAPANPYDPYRPGEPISVTMLRQGFNEGVKAARG